MQMWELTSLPAPLCLAHMSSSSTSRMWKGASLIGMYLHGQQVATNSDSKFQGGVRAEDKSAAMPRMHSRGLPQRIMASC